MRQAVCHDAELCQHLFVTARFHASRLQINAADSEDCALEFVMQMLSRGEAANRVGDRSECRSAWIRRCAINHVLNYRRQILRRQRHIAPEVDSAILESGDVPDGRGCRAVADHALLMRELGQRIEAAICQLDPRHRDLFIRRFVHGQSIEEIAVSASRTPNAVRKILTRVRGRLQRVLARQGATEAELRDYLTPAA